MKAVTLLAALFFALIGYFGGNRDKDHRTKREYWDMLAMYAIGLILFVLWILIMFAL